jgi:general secretion pathway protein G
MKQSKYSTYFNAQPNSVKTQSGFSLIEIMIVLTLLGVIMTFAVRNFVATQDEGNRRAAQIQMKQFKSMLDDYYRLCNQYPSNVQGGLDALVTGPTDGSCKDYDPSVVAVKKIPKDPWKMDYIYTSEDGRSFVIKSLGSDKKEGGTGNARDINTDDPDF